MNKISPPAHCAVCGTEIPRAALACPECGADELTGWREQNIYDGLDLPETEFDAGSPRKGKQLFWWIVAIVMLAAMLALVLPNRFWISP